MTPEELIAEAERHERIAAQSPGDLTAVGHVILAREYRERAANTQVYTIDKT